MNKEPAWMAAFPRKTPPPFRAGADFRRPGAPMHGAGQRSGAAPISCAEAPAARCDATISRGRHPGGETGRLGDKQK